MSKTAVKVPYLFSSLDNDLQCHSPGTIFENPVHVNVFAVVTHGPKMLFAEKKFEHFGVHKLLHFPSARLTPNESVIETLHRIVPLADGIHNLEFEKVPFAVVEDVRRGVHMLDIFYAGTTSDLTESPPKLGADFPAEFPNPRWCAMAQRRHQVYFRTCTVFPNFEMVMACFLKYCVMEPFMGSTNVQRFEDFSQSLLIRDPLTFMLCFLDEYMSNRKRASVEKMMSNAREEQLDLLWHKAQ